MCASNCGNCDTCAPDIQPGRRGPRGNPGPPNTLSFSVTMLPTGSPETADVTGVSPNQHLALGIPASPSPVISALVNTLAAGLNATVSVDNTDPLNPIITFGIPRGANGTNGISCFSSLAQPFTMPAVGASLPATFVNNDWVNIGLPIQLGPTTWLICETNPGVPGGFVSLRNPGAADGFPTGISYNAAPGSTFGAGTVVSCRGRDGLQGPAGAVTPISVATTTSIPVAPPAAGGEIVLYADNLLTPTTVNLYAWNGSAWSASPSLIGPAGTLWQTSNGDPNSTLPSGPIGTFVLRTDVLSIYQRVGPSTWNLIGSLTPTFDQVWTQSSGLTTRPQYYSADTTLHTVPGNLNINLQRALTVVNVQADITLNYTSVGNYGEWWVELINTTASPVTLGYATGKFEKNTGVTEVTSLAASGSPGDRVLLHMFATNSKLLITEFLVPVAI